MSQDNDPWGNDPRNTESNELSAIFGKIKESLFGKDKDSGNDTPPPQSFGGLPNIPGKAIAPIVTVAFLGWLSTGVYTLPEGFHGVELTFGRHSETATQPGFNFHKPFLIGSVKKVDIGSLKSLSVGSNNGNSEGQMLTSDENIVEISLSVQYKIGKAKSYLFNVNNPELVLKETLVSSIREVVGGSNVDYILTDGRAEWPAKVRDNLIDTLKGFNIGFDVLRVELRNAKAPIEVQAAFDDAVKAREDADRYKLQAEAYRNKQVPLARGEARQILEGSEGYKVEVIAKATGEANRFEEVLAAYQLAPQVTRDRMYLDTLRSVYENVNNVVVATDKNAPIMYFPIGQGDNKSTSSAVLPPPLKPDTNNHFQREDKFEILVPKPQKRLTR